MTIASGRNLAVTLGLNLVSLSGEAGTPKWTGHFNPTDPNAAIPYIEALTWNPRRIHLLPLKNADVCWRCGRVGVEAVGPIVYEKNDNTKQRFDKQPFEWQDPAAFYAADMPYKTKKSTKEEMAALGRDLAGLANQDKLPTAAVVVANPNHQAWCLVIPCTNPANNKTFDHRQTELTGLLLDAVRSKLPAAMPPPIPWELDGWTEPRRAPRHGGAAAFVRAAARFLTPTDWAALSGAAYREMHDSPAAFDVFSGLLWPLRGKVAGLPSKNVAWLVLKLMAAVPSRARIVQANATCCPLRFLPKRQLDDRSPYPVSFPRGLRLEADLRGALDSNMRKRTPEPIDWAGLCDGLDQLID